MKNSILIIVIILAATLSTHAKNLDNTTGKSNCQESYCVSVFNLSMNTLNELWKIGNDQIFKIEEEKIQLFFEDILSSDRAEPNSNQSASELNKGNWNVTSSIKTQSGELLKNVSQMIKSLLGQ